MTSAIKSVSLVWVFFKVCVKSFQRIVCKHIINFRNILLNCVTKPVNYEALLNCGVTTLVFPHFCVQDDLGGAKTVAQRRTAASANGPAPRPSDFLASGRGFGADAGTLSAFENRESGLFFFLKNFINLLFYVAFFNHSNLAWWLIKKNLWCDKLRTHLISDS